MTPPTAARHNVFRSLVASAEETLTVEGMDMHAVPSSHGEGVFRLLERLSNAQRLLLDARAEADSEFDPLVGDLIISLPDDLVVVENVYEDTEKMTMAPCIMDIYGCWWFDSAECTHGDNPPENSECDCGPVTLLEVTSHIAASDRQMVFDAHLGRLTELWDHFWSGEALMSAKSSELGAACAECLLHPQGHLVDVIGAAQETFNNINPGLKIPRETLGCKH